VTIDAVSTRETIRVTNRVLAVAAEADPIIALDVMRRNHVRHLPVIQGRSCVGLLTEAGLLRALALLPPDVRSQVGALCTAPAPTVPAGSSPATIAAAILVGAVDAVLVVRDTVLVGIVTTTDVLAQIAGRMGDPDD